MCVCRHVRRHVPRRCLLHMSTHVLTHYTWVLAPVIWTCLRTTHMSVRGSTHMSMHTSCCLRLYSLTCCLFASLFLFASAILTHARTRARTHAYAHVPRKGLRTSLFILRLLSTRLCRCPCCIRRTPALVLRVHSMVVLVGSPPAHAGLGGIATPKPTVSRPV